MWNKVVSKGQLSAFALFLSLSGCTALSDCKYEVGQKIRTSQAWHEFDGCHDQCFTCDYSSGWKAGYYDVATGGEGCPPVIAPKKYWKPPVFVEYDPSLRDDWYCGFQDGAACAKCQPDHHYLQTYLPPRTCCPVQPACCPEVIDEPSDYIQGDPAYGDPETDSPMPTEGPATEEVAPAPAVQPEVQQPSVEPTPTPAPAPAAGENYEKDPAPASAPATTKHVPSANSTLRQRLVKQYQEQQRQQASAARESLLRQLVQNAVQPSVDNGF